MAEKLEVCGSGGACEYFGRIEDLTWQRKLEVLERLKDGCNEGPRLKKVGDDKKMKSFGDMEMVKNNNKKVR